MKRLFAAILVLMMALSLCACGDTSSAKCVGILGEHLLQALHIFNIIHVVIGHNHLIDNVKSLLRLTYKGSWITHTHKEYRLMAIVYRLTLLEVEDRLDILRHNMREIDLLIGYRT